ncbi:MAG: hypothetical protein AB7V77_01005 [Candidatus Woesearchaeota archaeon]
MGLLKNLTLSALLLSKLLFANPGTEITSFGDVGIKFNKYSKDLKEFFSLNSNSFVGVYLESTEIPNVKLKGYFSSNNQFIPSFGYELYNFINDTTEIQGIVLDSQINKKRFEHQGYSLESKFINLNYERERSFKKQEISSSNINWIKEEQENNEELQNIIESIDGANWSVALLQLISASITNSINNATGEFNRIDSKDKINIYQNINRYSVNLNFPKYDAKSGVKLSQIETEATFDQRSLDIKKLEEYVWFTNVFHKQEVKQTTNLFFVNQDMFYDSEKNKDYDISFDVKSITCPPQRHMFSVNWFYNKLHSEDYQKATGVKLEMKLTEDKNEHHKNEISKFKKENEIIFSPYENNKLKQTLIEELKLTSNVSGSGINLQALFDDNDINFIVGINYYGKESGMDVKYDINKQGGKISYIFANKGIFSITIDGEIKLSAGLKINF